MSEDGMARQESVRLAKAALRRRVSSKMASISSDAIHRQSERVAASIIQSPYYQNARRLSVYLSMPGKELQTASIVEHALSSGKQVFVPYIHRNRATKESAMDMLHLRSADDYHSLKPDSWGIPSLDATTVQARGNCFGGHGLGGDGSETRPLDLILMPGAAFDQTFRRLGHGKGYYDRFLQKYQDAVRNVPNGRMPLLVALAIEEQLLKEDGCVPITEHDWLVDAIATASGSISTRMGGPCS